MSVDKNHINKQTFFCVLRRAFVFGLCLSVLQVFAVIAQQAPASTPSQGQQPNLTTLDLKSLIQTSDRNGASMHKRLVEYTYIQRRTTREAGPKGKLVQQVREFEAYPVKFEGRHRHVLSLIKKDGVPVSEAELEQNRLYAAREMEKAEHEEMAPTPAANDAERYITAGIGIGASGEGVWLGVSQFLRSCQFEAPRLTQLNGRETVALALHSCDGQLATPSESYLRQLIGFVWIDLADKVVVRLEAWPGSNVLPPAEIFTARPATEVVVYEQQLVRDEMWAPRRIRLNGIGKGRLFNGVDKEMIFEFVDYKHFSTEVKEKDSTEPIKKPLG